LIDRVLIGTYIIFFLAQRREIKEDFESEVS